MGKQWMWYLQHAEGRAEINELHVPLGRPIRLNMTSQDVIHSFYVPAFRVKQDVLPGRDTSLWFEPSQGGPLPSLLCRVLRHESFDDGGLGDGDGTGRLSALADRGGSRAVDGRSKASGSSSSTTARAATGAVRPCKAPKLEGVFGKPVPIQNGKDVRFVTADTAYIRDSILMPKSQVVAGYEPLDAVIQGSDP